MRLDRLGFRTDCLVPGFDDRVFKSVSPSIKAALKAKYDLPSDRFIVLHVGHVTENRNLEVLLRYRDWGADIQPVVKAGMVDPSWAHRLRMAGIIVIDEYLADVHELYQAADCYLFPVISPYGAVDLPLSIIEACAANLPVITTRFGAIPERIEAGDGFLYYDRISEIPRLIAAVRGVKPATAAKVKDLSWDSVFRRHLHPHLKALLEERKGA
jgi:glycosyltransferase involved in cell wall biosynthesis